MNSNLHLMKYEEVCSGRQLCSAHINNKATISPSCKPPAFNQNIFYAISLPVDCNPVLFMKVVLSTATLIQDPHQGTVKNRPAQWWKVTKYIYSTSQLLGTSTLPEYSHFLQLYTCIQRKYCTFYFITFIEELQHTISS